MAGTRRVEAVVLDMDGLMFDTETIYKASWQRTVRELGYDLDDVFYATLVGRPNVDNERLLMEHFGASFPMDDFRRRWPELWRDTALTGGIEHKPGLDALLAYVETYDLPKAVATSTVASLAAFTLETAGLKDHFACIVTGDQVRRGKPAPDIYLEAARRLDVAPSRTVALEDSNNGTLAAAHAGMLTLMIPDAVTPTAAAVRAAYRVVPTLTDALAVIRELRGDEPES